VRASPSSLCRCRRRSRSPSLSRRRPSWPPESVARAPRRVRFSERIKVLKSRTILHRLSRRKRSGLPAPTYRNRRQSIGMDSSRNGCCYLDIAELFEAMVHRTSDRGLVRKCANLSKVRRYEYAMHAHNGYITMCALVRQYADLQDVAAKQCTYFTLY
jgi:hypothetical protein